LAPLPPRTTFASGTSAVFVELRVTVKLPEKGIGEALAELVKLDAKSKLLDRDVSVIDLRLPDRITVRLPEGRTLDDVTSEIGTTKQRKTRT
jgi:cell division protein FtsQ